MNLVVSDASPVNYLILIGEVDILPKLFSRVLLPRAVWQDELQHPDAPAPVRAWAKEIPDWVEVRDPCEVPSSSLHPGETHAIALALEQHCPILLDEREARTFARLRGLRILGTVGLLEQAAIQGLIHLPSVFDRLRKTNARIHPAILQDALARHSARCGIKS